jgi:hypothetical protein
MADDKPTQRMTLRELLGAADKGARELVELYRATLLGRMYEVRDLSRPVRRRTPFPSMQAVQNSLNKLQGAAEEARKKEVLLLELLQEIRDRARQARS